MAEEGKEKEELRIIGNRMKEIREKIAKSPKEVQLFQYYLDKIAIIYNKYDRDNPCLSEEDFAKVLDYTEKVDEISDETSTAVKRSPFE